MNRKNKLLKLFMQNTGRTTMNPPRMETNIVRLAGYQVPRVDKYRWQERV